MLLGEIWGCEILGINIGLRGEDRDEKVVGRDVKSEYGEGVMGC